MVRPRTIADTLTAVRPILALYLIWLGLVDGAQALPIAAVTLFVAWVTDLMDGYFARKDGKQSITWIGACDLQADLSIATAVWIYLWQARFVSPFISLAYFLAAALLLLLTRNVQVGWGIQAVPYGTMIWITWLQLRPLGWFLIAWILFVVMTTWPRFPKRTLPDFLEGIGSVFRR